MKKYQSFSSENFRNLEVKFSIYLNRRVFVILLGESSLLEVFPFTLRKVSFVSLSVFKSNI